MVDNINQIPLIETRQLSKYFKVPKGLLRAVEGIDVSIYEGKTLGVVGESGCGKSTLGRVILRLIDSTSGETLFMGDDITKFDKAQLRNFRQKAQIIFQDPFSSVNPRLTVSEIIAEPMIVYRMNKSKSEREETISALMETVGLSDRIYNAYPHELDGGRLQRVGVARALTLHPKFIVCDEPVSALDVSIQAQILNLLMDLQQQMGLTYMFITHNLSVVKHISNEIIVMYLGKCVEKAPTKELFKNPMHPYTKALLSAIPVLDIDTRGKPRKLLSGEVTSPIDPPPGCRFAARCEFLTDACTGKDPELKEVSTGHFVACVLYK